MVTLGCLGVRADYDSIKVLARRAPHFAAAREVSEATSRDVAVFCHGSDWCRYGERIKQTQPQSVKYLCLVAAPEGIAHFTEQHSDVPVFTAAIDEKLNDHGYICPGLGDAGDRYYGTC